MLLEVEFVWCKRSKYVKEVNILLREKHVTWRSLSDVKEVNILLREKSVTWSGVCLM